MLIWKINSHCCFIRFIWSLHRENKPEQLEQLRSEDTPHRPMITHTIDHFILDPKPILLTTSYWIPRQNKTKSTFHILKNLPKLQFYEFWNRQTRWNQYTPTPHPPHPLPHPFRWAGGYNDIHMDAEPTNGILSISCLVTSWGHTNNLSARSAHFMTPKFALEI